MAHKSQESALKDQDENGDTSTTIKGGGEGIQILELDNTTLNGKTIGTGVETAVNDTGVEP